MNHRIIITYYNVDNCSMRKKNMRRRFVSTLKKTENDRSAPELHKRVGYALEHKSNCFLWLVPKTTYGKHDPRDEPACNTPSPYKIQCSHSAAMLVFRTQAIKDRRTHASWQPGLKFDRNLTEMSFLGKSLFLST